ncbi:AUGMIN subunit 1-like [Copidosoma floridanum]|uniref:AUGMIN subunit 1-like n=1 Tax=Copidosoma floridanum TaxID=29053 RepID=UPI0006C98B63|nr:AUGMIN subunit 1-like [Copidosoma floridanum]XP_023244964.1 AUGMIN subunit 1-like [Copidosoma floridanum]
MESSRRTESNLSISSIVSDSNLKEDDTDTVIKSNAMLKILLEAASDTNAENLALGSEISELLSALKFDLKLLPPDIRDGLQTVVAILKSEGLASVDETMLTLCLEKKKIENKMKEREERLLRAKYNYAFTKYNAFECKLNQLRKEIEEVEDTLQEKISNDENEESNRILWSSRLHDYKDTVKKLEEELNELNIKEIGIEAIQQKSSILMEKLNDLVELDQELSKYKDLPPNLLQAKNALENKRKEQQAVENALHEILS